MRSNQTPITLTFQTRRNGALLGEQELSGSAIKIGTLSSAQLRIAEDDTVARVHALIQVDPSGTCTVADLGSATGTRVNGRAITRSALQEGDRIQVGATEIRLRKVTQQAAPVAVPTATPVTQAAAAPAPAPQVEPEPDHGERALEVVAVYGDTPQQVQHFRKASTGRTKPLSVALLAAGLVLAIGGAAAFGSQIWSVKKQEAHRANVLAFIKERGLPEKFAPVVRTHQGLEVGGALGFAGGLFLLMFGAFRLRDERYCPSFTIGEDPAASFVTPVDGLPSSKFQMVSADGERYQLHFTRAMEGHVQCPGQQMCALADLAQRGQARPADEPGTWVWPIPDGARCRISYGRTTFQVNSVPRGGDVAEERLSKRALAVLGTPIAASTFGSATVLGVFLMLFQWQPTGDGSLEVDSIGERNRKWVRDLRSSARKDETVKPKAKPKPIKPPKVEKTKHQPKSKSKITGINDDRMRTVSPGKAGPGSTSRPSTATGRNAGMLGVLNSRTMKLSNMFSRDSLAALAGHTYGSGDPLDGLGEGGRGGGTNGAGGVTLSSGWPNGGKGGGGPFANGGFPGGGVPIGPGIRKYNPHDVRVFNPGEAEVLEGIDAGTIKRIIRRYLNQVRYCYISRGLPSNPRLKGTVKVAFMISPNGKVLKATIASSTLNNPATERCIVGSMRTWRFPKTGGKTAFVKYPFRFLPAGAR